MTALFRLFIWLVVLAGLGLGSMLALVYLVEPTPREIVVDLPATKLRR